mgnify:FL=1
MVVATAPKVVKLLGPASRWFSWEELQHTSKPLPNIAGPLERLRLQALAAEGLDRFRDFLGRPLSISSAFRSKLVNMAVGGAKASQHMTGEAADLTVPGSGWTSEQLAAAWLASGIPFDKLVWYTDKPHLHVSYRRGNNRGLVMKSVGGSYPQVRPAASSPVPPNFAGAWL